jgi:hypothetical protein
MVVLARSVSCGSNEAVTLLYLVSSPSSATYRVKTQDLKRSVSHHWPVSPVTQQIALCFLYCFSVLWALLLLTYVVASKIWSCHELDCMDICVIIMAGLLKFQSLIWMGVSIVKCLTAVQIRHMIRLFEFWCECTPIRRHFKNLSCVTSVFFTFTVHFASNPLSEICYVHLCLTAVGRHHEGYRKLF